MKKIITFTAVIVSLAVSAPPISISQNITPQTVTEFSCIGTLTSACSNGEASLRNWPGSSPALTYVSVAGYYAASDGGGGNFYRLGLVSGSGATCVSTSTLSGSGTVGSPTISGLSSVSGFIPGELVNVSGGSGTIQTQPGAEIASINNSMGHYAITLTLPLTGTATVATTVSGTVSGDNNGTLIVDAGGD